MIGHMVHLEGCVIEDDALVGSGSVVLHGAGVLLGHGGGDAVVPNRMVVPSGDLALGIPAKLARGRCRTARASRER